MNGIPSAPRVILILALALTLPMGCSERAASPTETIAPSVGGASAPPGEGDLDPINRLALGTLKLEETEHAVTPAQADELLSLWQIIQNGSLAGDAETMAVLKQIEGRMEEAQLATIDGLGLTFEDMREWLQAQSIEMPAASSREGGPSPVQELSQEEQVRLREELQNMTREQRAAQIAELGSRTPKRAGPGAMRSGGVEPGSVLLDPLIALLAERAT